MSNGRPFGNDFIVSTPKLDQLSQRLYMEGKQRELQNQQNAKALDDEFSKNVSKIRDADVDDLTKSYQDYKAATQAAMKVKGGVSPAQQMEILRKKAAMFKLINESGAEKEREEMDAKRYYIKPDDFNDNAPQLMTEGRKLPLSQKRTYTSKDEKGNPITVDLTNRENLLWQDKTNWQPILQKAGGTLVQRGKPVEVLLPGGLEKEVTTYKGGNDPLEYYTSIVGSMNTARAGQSLATRYNFTPAEAQDIILKFDVLKKDPTFKNAYGDIVFPESSNATEGTRTAKLLAMVNAINNPPIAEKPVRVKDLAATMNKAADIALSRQKEMAAIHDMYTMKHIGYKAALDLGNIIATDSNVDELFNKMGTNLPSGLVNKVFDIPKDEAGHEFPPPSIKKSGDGSNYIFYYGTPGEKGYYEKQVPVAIVKTQWKQDVGTALKTKTNIPAETQKKGTQKKKLSW